MQDTSLLAALQKQSDWWVQFPVMDPAPVSPLKPQEDTDEE